MDQTLLLVLSHVAHGYVGNRAMVFPLQHYGWDVDAVHTTDFLNHPGYGKFAGTKSTPEQISLLLAGLRAILDIDTHYRMVVVGYCPSGAMLRAVYDGLKPTLEGPSRPVVVVDPVLGDNGRLYVPEDAVEAQREVLRAGFVALATPNQFEMELLTDVKISDLASAARAVAEFRRRYRVRNVVVSSATLNGALCAVGAAENSAEVFAVPIAEIACGFSGCGDVFTALLANAFYANACVLDERVVAVVARKLHAILAASYAYEHQRTGRAPTAVHDLRLVQLRAVFGDDVRGEIEAETAGAAEHTAIPE